MEYLYGVLGLGFWGYVLATFLMVQLTIAGVGEGGAFGGVCRLLSAGEGEQKRDQVGQGASHGTILTEGGVERVASSPSTSSSGVRPTGVFILP